MIAKPKAAALCADLPKHTSKGYKHPVRLLAVVRSLHTPAAHYHRRVVIKRFSQLFDSFFTHAANATCPFDIFFNAIFFAIQIGFKFIKACGVIIKEFVIYLFLVYKMACHS